MKLGPGLQRGLQVAVLSAVMLVVAAIAGASPGGYFDLYGSTDLSDTAVTEEVEPSPTPSETVSPTPSPAPDDSADDAEAGDDKPSDAPGENHGKYVSKVAKCVPSGPGKGAAVSEMARTHENEAAKAEEICSRYSSPPEEEADESQRESEARDRGGKKPEVAGKGKGKSDRPAGGRGGKTSGR